MKAALLLFLFCLSAEADDIRWEFNELKRQLEGVEGQNKDMASRLSASETKIGELQARLSASETKTGELQSRLSASETKRENWHIADLTCYTGTGRNYRGTVSRTRSGITCQRWSSQTPHTHSRNPANFPFDSHSHTQHTNGGGNHMQGNKLAHEEQLGIQGVLLKVQPGGAGDRTGDLLIPRLLQIKTNSSLAALLRIMFCQLFMLFNVLSGRNYRGTVARTTSGKTCQSWSTQTPHTPYYTPDNYPHGGLDNNYCRNPDNSRMPWCHTTDPETRWEYCPVPRCDGVPRPESPLVPRETKQVLKLKLTPDDPTVDLNDPAVMEAILKQMKGKLEQSGVSGDVKLTWKKQPGGKVFQKEEETK